MIENLKAFLDSKVSQYNRPDFIKNDPVSIPHLFTKKQDIELMGFWAATLAWGQRITIINKCKELIALMDGTPYDFIVNHEEPDLKKLLHFKHRTFNDTDTLYFISFFRYHYSQHESLEDAFIMWQGCHAEALEAFGQRPTHTLRVPQGDTHRAVEIPLNAFRNYFFSLPDFPHRTKKHI